MAQVCVCERNLQVLDDGNLCVIPGSLGLQERIVLDTPGEHQFIMANFPWLARVDVQVVGGGGGGGGAMSADADPTPGGGGGGGGYARRLIDVADLNPAEVVTVGAGGGGGFNTDDGVNGDITSFGTHLSGQGGDGGFSGSNGGNLVSGGRGGFGVGGQVNVRGGDGGNGMHMADGIPASWNHGGETFLSTRTRGNSTDGGADGIAGDAYGGGGSGARDRSTNTPYTGGAGAAGVVIIELYG